MRHAGRFAVGPALGLAVLLAGVCADADEPSAPPSPPAPAPAPAPAPDEGAAPRPSEADMVPVLIEAGSDYVSLGEAECHRGNCVARVPRGAHSLVRQTMKDGVLTTEFSATVTIERPSVVSVTGNGALYTASWVTLAVGATLTVAGILVPLLVCHSSQTVDPTTGRVISSNPCDRISDPAKIAWIGGLGVGITLSLVGAVGLAVTSAPPRASVEPWNDPHPATTAHTGPRVTFVPFVDPTRIGDHVVPSWGAALTGTF